MTEPELKPSRQVDREARGIEGTMTEGGRFTVEDIRNLGATCDAHEAAAITGRGLRWVQRQAKEGNLPAVKVGNSYLFNVAKLCELCGIEL